MNVRTRRIYSALAAFVLSLGATSARANPTGAEVVAGQVDFSLVNPKVLEISNSPNSIINWQSFSIGRDEIARFIQQGASSAVLNRVVGGDLSSILGRLESNGQVYLVNPNGIFFGPNAVVDVAGLVASTLNISDEDFLRGDFRFLEGNGGAILNEGTLQALDDILLVAPEVSNEGAVFSDNGNVLLAAGESVLAIDPEMLEVEFELQAPENDALNLGEVYADNVGIFGGTVEQAGRVEVAADGRVRLLAAGDTILHANAEILAAGGDVEVLGERVALLDNTVIDVSADHEGGTVHIGGEYLGGGDTPTASATVISNNVGIIADALLDGDGGEVIVWSDDLTKFYGSISAQGAGNGSGGFVETSSADHLEAMGSVTLGEGGNWLLDPRNVTISQSTSLGGDFGAGDPTIFTPIADNAVADASQIETSLAAGTDVTITTGVDGSQNGDITLVGDLLVDMSGAPGGVAVLKLDAEGDILLQGGICDGTGCGVQRVSGDLDMIFQAGGSVRFQAGATRIDAGSGGLIDIQDNTATGGSGDAIFESGVILNGNFSAGDITGSAQVSDLIEFAGGAVSLNNSLTWDQGDLSLQTAGDILVPNFQWTGGDISGSSGITATSNTGTAFEISGATLKTLGTTLKNQSTSFSNFISGNVTANSGAVIRNEGRLEISSSAGVNFLSGGATGLFENASGANLEISTGDLITSQFEWVFKDFGGSVNFSNFEEVPSDNAILEFAGGGSVFGGALTAGGNTRIDFSSSGFTFALGSTVAIDELRMVSGTTQIAADSYSANAMSLDGGALTISTATSSVDSVDFNAGILQLGGSFTASQLFDWSGGTLRGTGTLNVPVSGQFLLDTTGSAFLSDASILHASTTGTSLISGSSSSSISFSGDASFNNSGVLNFSSPNRIATSVTTTQFVNTGTMNVDTGFASNQVRIDVPFNNSGVVNISDSSDGGAGSPGLFNGLYLTGGGTHTGTFDLTVPTLNAGLLTLGGNHTFQAGSSVDGGFASFFFGNGSTSTTISSTNFLPDTVSMRNANVIIDADIAWDSLDILRQGSGTSVLELNTGRTLTVNTDFDWFHGEITGTGTLDYSAAATAAALGADSTSVMTLSGATINGGGLSLNQGALDISSGALNLNGVFTMTGANAPTLNLSGGTLDFGEGVNPTYLGPTIPTGAVLNMTGGNLQFTAGGLAEKLFIEGTLNFTDGNINAPGGFVTRNGGLFTISSSVNNAISSTSGQFTASNGGTIRKLADGTGTTTLNMRLATSGTGAFELLGGTLDASSDGVFAQTGSELRLLGGNMIVGINDSGLADYLRVRSGAKLFGGSTTLTGDVFSEGGVIHAGNSAGDFTITGTLDLDAASTLAVEIFGATKGTQFDHFTIGNLVVNDATMTVDFGGFTPAGGSSFPVIDYTSFSGTGFNTFTPTLGSALLNNVGNQFLVDLGGLLQFNTPQNWTGDQNFAQGIELTSTIDWTGGNISISGDLVIKPGGEFRINNTSGLATTLTANALIIDASATLDLLATSDFLTTINAPVTINGKLAGAGGLLNFSQAVQVASGGLMSLAGNTMNFNNTFENLGTLNQLSGTTTLAGASNANKKTATVSGGTFTVSGSSLVNTGTFNVSGGTANFGALYTQNSGLTRLSGGNLNATTFRFDGGTFNMKNATLNGNVDFSFGNATFSPGLSPGRTIINGNLTLGPNSNTLIEIFGTAPETQYDVIDVIGTANLDGKVTFSFGTFLPSSNSLFTFMSASSGFAGTTFAQFVNANGGVLQFGNVSGVDNLSITGIQIASASSTTGLTTTSTNNLLTNSPQPTSTGNEPIGTETFAEEQAVATTTQNNESGSSTMSSSEEEQSSEDETTASNEAGGNTLGSSGTSDREMQMCL